MYHMSDFSALVGPRAASERTVRLRVRQAEAAERARLLAMAAKEPLSGAADAATAAAAKAQAESAAMVV